jgi:hypothetical protein
MAILPLSQPAEEDGSGARIYGPKFTISTIPVSLPPDRQPAHSQIWAAVIPRVPGAIGRSYLGGRGCVEKN